MMFWQIIFSILHSLIILCRVPYSIKLMQLQRATDCRWVTPSGREKDAQQTIAFSSADAKLSLILYWDI